MKNVSSFVLFIGVAAALSFDGCAKRNRGHSSFSSDEKTERSSKLGISITDSQSYISDGPVAGAYLEATLTGPEGSIQSKQKFGIRYKGHGKGEKFLCSDLKSELVVSVEEKQDKVWMLGPASLSRDEVWGFRSVSPSIPVSQRALASRSDEELTYCLYEDHSFGKLIERQTIAVNDPTKVLFSKIPDTYSSSTEYGQQCAKEIGYLKAFSCFDPAYTVEIPITVNNHQVSKRVAECDRPSWFPMSFGTCVPGNRIGRLKTYRDAGLTVENIDADTVFICRRLHDMRSAIDPVFDDIAMIQHDRKTGKTCFFQQLASDAGPKTANRIPPPHEVDLPRDVPADALPSHRFWIAPFRYTGFECTGCHDSDPFIHSPLVENILDASGEQIVPSDPKGPYQLVGNKYPFRKVNISWAQGATQRRVYNWPDVVSISVKGDSTCTSCHRIGSERTCEDFVWFSTGRGNRASIADERDSPDPIRLYPTGVNENAKHMLKDYWMPPEHGLSRAEWEKRFSEGYHKIAYCCGGNIVVPQGTSCKTEPLITIPD